MTVPTLLLFHRGQALERIDGYRPIQVLRDELEQVLSGVWS
jgi:thioredoxin-like negative regulator of GroEL